VHVSSGALFVVAGLACLRYVWAGASAFEHEPPVLAFGVLLIGVGAGLILRARAAHLLARAALGLVILAVVVKAVRLYAGAPAYPDERLVAHVYLLGFALVAAGAVVMFLLAPEAQRTAGCRSRTSPLSAWARSPAAAAGR
jgi:hypothetical protein